MAKQSHQELQQAITDQIIEAIEGGIQQDGKWVRPWNVSNTFPMNAATGKQYNGMNALLLMMLGGGFFAGYGQWKEKHNAQVRKGEKGIQILAPIMRKTGKILLNGKEEMAPCGYRSVKVFSAVQVDGWTPPVIEANEDFQDHAAAEQAIAETVGNGLDLRHGGDRAFYSGGQNFVQMPAKEQFPVESDYYATMLHELVHWTGHSTRLDRHKAIDGKHGKNSYAFEELVAELGAAMLCGELGVHNGYRDDHAKYVGGWLDIMRGDSTAIMEAASMASKAVDVIMGRRTLKGAVITKVDVKEAA